MYTVNTRYSFKIDIVVFSVLSLNQTTNILSQRNLKIWKKNPYVLCLEAGNVFVILLLTWHHTEVVKSVKRMGFMCWSHTHKASLQTDRWCVFTVWLLKRLFVWTWSGTDSENENYSIVNVCDILLPSGTHTMNTTLFWKVWFYILMNWRWVESCLSEAVYWKCLFVSLSKHLKLCWYWMVCAN